MQVTEEDDEEKPKAGSGAAAVAEEYTSFDSLDALDKIEKLGIPRLYFLLVWLVLAGKIKLQLLLGLHKNWRGREKARMRQMWSS